MPRAQSSRALDQFGSLGRISRATFYNAGHRQGTASSRPEHGGMLHRFGIARPHNVTACLDRQAASKIRKRHTSRESETARKTVVKFDPPVLYENHAAGNIREQERGVVRD
jgi:hypothetical protein